ncbi:MAG: acyl-CoA dehydrogenase family protein [Actinobacteria bacterium]|nr:acyl-CoA dehydrogenase family protein [Actinomycetota bacterium]MCB9388992.1 acyl-CoA dehydrogenase family protein [Acidimicrobiia bacterium]
MNVAHLSAEDVRSEVESWVASNWNPDLTVGQWWELLGRAGWSVPTWPEEWYGRGYTRDLGAVVFDELRKANVLGPPIGLGLVLAGPTILTHGSEEQKQRYLWPIVSGQEAWCQLFSEPGAGSDLASIACRADADEEGWTVNGQKVWTSGGQFAELGMLMARTDVNLPKHQGITYFAFDMIQSGVEVRPLREMTGRALFNEVFISDARVTQDQLIGGLGNGWKVANTTLMFERTGLGAGGQGGMGQVAPGSIAGMLDKRVGDQTGRSGGAVMGVGREPAKAFATLAKARGVQDTVTRQMLAQLHTLTEIGRYTQLRAKAAQLAGKKPGPESSTGKLLMSNIIRLSRETGLRILGADAMLNGPDAPLDGRIQEMALFSPAPSIYGGSDQIQRNIIGERVLGLPREPSADRDVPFKDLRLSR